MSRTLVALLLLFLSVGCARGAEPGRIIEKPLTVQQVLAHPERYEGTEVLVRGALVSGSSGTFVRAPGSDASLSALYPPLPLTPAVFVPLGQDQIPESMDVCVGGGNVSIGSEVLVRGIFRHDEERVFGPKPGWVAQIEAPELGCI